MIGGRPEKFDVVLGVRGRESWHHSILSGGTNGQRSSWTCVGGLALRSRQRDLRWCQDMIARLFIALLALTGVNGCRSEVQQASNAEELGPETVLLYTEIPEALRCWLVESSSPEGLHSVTYDDSADLGELYDAVHSMVSMNEGGQHKAVSAVVTWRWTKSKGFDAVQLRTADDVQIVELPPRLLEVWRVAAEPPPPQAR